jgi:hypothetical protein
MMHMITVVPTQTGWVVMRGRDKLAELPSRIDAEAFAIMFVDGDGMVEVLNQDGQVEGLLRRTSHGSE